MLTRRRFLSTTAAGCCLPALNLPVRAAEETADQAGFYMPLESDPHVRTFMQWPSDVSIYGGTAEIHRVRACIATIANTIQQFEPVAMLVGPDFAEGATMKLKGQAKIWTVPTQDLWARDSGPSFVINDKGETAITELNFNGWGGKQNARIDSQVASLVAQKLGMRLFNNPVVGEGGGVETDGEGTLMAHLSCWVNPNRNQASADEVATQLCQALGAEKMIWAPGLSGQDITDYHIDSLARFVKPGQVVIQLPEDGDNSAWGEAARQTHEILKTATDAKGRKLEIVTMPSPVDIRAQEEDFLASYANYYVCNGAVIMAEFGDDETDEKAATILQQLYPGRQVISLNVDVLGELGGGIHCATQQQPKAG